MISVKIIADSISEHGSRITTFELEYQRFIHCFDEETEILSKIGNEDARFRSFEAVFALGAKVAQYDANSGNIVFVYPEKTIKQTGTFNMVSFDKKKFSMCVTDKHRVYLDKRTTNNEFKQTEILAKDLLGNYGTIRIPQAGWELQNQTFSDEEIELIAWYAADGHKENHNTSNFHFKKERKVQKVCELLKKCGIEFKTHTYGEDYVIRFDNPSWVDECYNEYGDKKLPPSATQMTQECYKKFKQALLESDGNVDNKEYNTTSIELAEQIQCVALLHGEAMNIRSYSQEGYKKLYKQKFKETNYVSLRQDKDMFEVREKETNVYCVTVPSSFVIVRRAGIAYVSGNCELMTHRLLSRNSASSRAIPFEKMLEQVENNPASPEEWGRNQAGMQAGKNFEGHEKATCVWAWNEAAKSAVKEAKRLADLGIHKQIVNRILEPFVHMKTIVTATEWDNFFWLRCHKDAQPEIRVLAEKMYKAYSESTPTLLSAGEWHVPYFNKEGVWRKRGCGYDHDDNDNECFLDEALKISASCCAQVSYRRMDDSLDKALSIYDRLVGSDRIHASPFEHQATPIGECEWDFELDGKTPTNLNMPEGITHEDRYGALWSGNFKGWIQHRQLIKGHTCWNYKDD